MSQSQDPTPKNAPATPPGTIDPRTGPEAQRDTIALRTALERAGECVGELQGQLKEHSAEIAHLKQLLAQSSRTLGHLQDSITSLRAERHKLANEAMRVMGLEAVLKKVTAERDRLKTERDGILQGLADQVTNNPLLRFEPRDVQIAELTMQLIRQKEELAEARKTVERYTGSPAPKPAMPARTGIPCK